MKIIGESIKKYRVMRGMTLKDLAKTTNVSVSFLSQIENGKNYPSLPTAKAIADVLNISMGTLMGEAVTQPNHNCQLIKKENRPKLENIGKGLKLEFLTLLDKNHFFDSSVHFLSEDAVWGDPPFKHEGQELIFLLKGCIELKLGNETMQMEEGDSIYIDSSIEHSFKNRQTDEAEFLCINCPPYFY